MTLSQSGKPTIRWESLAGFGITTREDDSPRPAGRTPSLFDFPAGTDSMYRLPCKTLTAEEEAAHSDAGRSRFVNGMLIESG